MKKWQKRVWIPILSFCLCAFVGLPVHAGSAQGTETENQHKEKTEDTLTDVRKAPEKRGKWVKKKGHYLYKLRDGTYARNTWLKIKKKIYRFDQKGFRMTGWHKYCGNKYYAASNGVMQTGFKKSGSARYYFKKNGIMASGQWIKSKGRYYYFRSNGKMAKGWLILGKSRYYLDPDGVRVSGDYYIKNRGYHFNRAGVYQPGMKVTGINPNKPMIALTFDDGPGPYTERLLRALKKNKAKATFFLVGRNVGKYKKTVKKAYQAGCEIGNHSWDHPQLTALGAGALSAQLNQTNRVVRSVTGHNPTLLRPPYGAYNYSVKTAAGMPVIMWSVDTLDWKTRNSQSTINSVMGNAKDGAIVLMHDIHLPTVIAAETLIPRLHRKGVQMVTVSEMAKCKKKRLRDGSVYSFIQ